MSPVSKKRGEEFVKVKMGVRLKDVRNPDWRRRDIEGIRELSS